MTDLVLLPREPTPEMIAAAGPLYSRAAWDLMVAAAPPPPDERAVQVLWLDRFRALVRARNYREALNMLRAPAPAKSETPSDV